MARKSVVLISSLSLLILISAQGSDANDIPKLCPTCDNPNPNCDPEGCNVGCSCPINTVADRHGKCVKIEECCKGNMTYGNGCSNECFESCERYFDSNRICPMFCKIGCTCKKGYWRPPNSNKCVLPHDCPKK